MKPGLLFSGVIAGALTLGFAAGCADQQPPPPAPGRYVSPLGADTGDCSKPSKACQTINYAVGQATAGQTVFVKDGIYPEMVNVDKPLKFSGPNAGRSAGVTPKARKAEAVVKGFRSPGAPHPTSAYEFNVTIDGFTVDPQGDTSLLAPDTHNLISLFGGTNVKVVNNIVTGGPFNPNCSYTCTDMTDGAIRVASGTYLVANNTVENFRRALDIEQPDAGKPIVSATYSGNVVRNFTFRAFWAAEWNGPFGANTVHIDGNQIIGSDDLVNNPPATGALVTAGGVTISNNTFKNLDTGVFEMLCSNTNPNDIPTNYQDNTFDQVGLGIQLYEAGDCTGRSTSPVIKGNAFLSGLWADGATWPGAGSPSTGIWLSPADPGPLDGACNFWGDENGPGVGENATAGANITTTPFQMTKGGSC